MRDRDRDRVIQAIRDAFPPYVVEDVIAPHECLECHSLRVALAEKSWLKITDEYVDEHDDVLPLFSPTAYHAFIPAWIIRGIFEPEGGVGTMVLINMTNQPSIEKFSPPQARAVIDALSYIVSNNGFPIGDEENNEYRAKIQETWAERAA